jgi:GntR family transcriptional regulator
MLENENTIKKDTTSMNREQALGGGPEPLHEQLKRIIREKIVTGEYQADDRLPSETELTQLYKVSRTTVRQALNDLVNEGILSRKQGVGTFIAPQIAEPDLVRLSDFVEDMAQAGIPVTSRIVQFIQESAPDEVAREMGLAPETKMVRVDRLRLGDGFPLAFDITWLPLRYGLLLEEEDLASVTIYRLLQDKFDIPVLHATYYLEACNATPEQAQLLEVEPRHALLLITRIAYTEGNRALYFQKRFIRSENLKYRLSVRQNQPGVSKERGSQFQEMVPVFTSTTG